MNKRLLFLFFAVQLHCSLWAQYTSTTLHFKPIFGEASLQLNKMYLFPVSADSISFTKLKFYISGIEFLDEEGKQWKEENSFHLMEAEENLDILLNLPAHKNYQQLKFLLGIDSVTNNAGALEGALDPTKGMYWSWQSGYINVKLEGFIKKASDQTDFEFHLGGYRAPNNCVQTVFIHLPKEQSSNHLNILLPVVKIFTQINVSTTNHIMSPGTDAVSLSQKIAASFSLSPL